MVRMRSRVQIPLLAYIIGVAHLGVAHLGVAHLGVAHLGVAHCESFPFF